MFLYSKSSTLVKNLNSYLLHQKVIVNCTNGVHCFVFITVSQIHVQYVWCCRILYLLFLTVSLDSQKSLFTYKEINNQIIQITYISLLTDLLNFKQQFVLYTLFSFYSQVKIKYFTNGCLTLYSTLETYNFKNFYFALHFLMVSLFIYLNLLKLNI